MKLKAYNVITEAIERGLTLGVNRAYKNTNKPSQEHIVKEVYRDVMLELDNVIDWELGNTNDLPR